MPICETCQDAGLIMRPEHVTQTVVNDNGEQLTLTHKIGGADACPDCAQLAEEEWRAKNG